MNEVKIHTVEVGVTSLAEFARFLRARKMNDFVHAIIRNSYELKIPLLKYFEGMSEEQRYRLSFDGCERLLVALRDKRINEYFEESKINWVNNQLPLITRDQVVVEDISLVNFARKKTFREFIPDFTSKTAEIVQLIEEIDLFFLEFDSLLFNTYLGLQEEQLRVSNEQLKKRESELLEAQAIASIGSFEWDLTDRKRSYYTPEVFKIFEMESTSNLETFLNDVHPDDRQKVQAAIERAMKEGLYECEYRYTRRNKFKILSSRGRVIFDKQKPVRMIGTIVDVTERAQLINRLKESEDLSKQAQALTHTGSWKWTVENDVIEWSDEMYRIYGLKPQSERITFQRFLTFIHDSDRNRRITEITDTLKTGRASDYLMRIVTKDGTEKILKGKGDVVLDKNGKVIGMLGTCQDITNEHNLQTQLQRKNEELLRRNKDLQSFNFIANHDLQEPLRKIQVYSNRILNEGVGQIPESLLKHFVKISQSSNRMQKMIEDFIIFYESLNVSQVSEKIDLNPLIGEISLELQDVILQKNASLKVEVLPSVRGIRPHIRQLFKHLISNSIKFSKINEPPRIVIKAHLEDIKDRTYRVISVKDNGIGFDLKYSAKIFELFQRLHGSEEFAGSGIGLSLCKKIAEDHEGWISVTSEEGVGSQFNVYMPQ
jgi:PAS domain S-box-containing protein